MKKSINILVFGHVQGVGYRWFVKRSAEKYQIKGYTINNPDKSVYIEAEGSEENLDSFILLCKQGPSHAIVDNIKVTSQKIKEFKYFDIRH